MVYDTTLYFNLFLFDVKKNHESEKHYAQILCHCQLSFPQVQVCHIHLVFSWLRLCMFMSHSPGVFLASVMHV